ncbi:hypothetical protein WN943_012698 [Citrus x changshan-huyou]
MESALCLNFCPSAAMRVKPVTKLGSGHSSIWISFSKGSTRRPFGRVFSPVICTHDGSSTPSENDNKIVKGAVGASLALTCALGIMSFSSRMNPKAIAAGPMEMYQKAPRMSVLPHPIGGRYALNSFLDVSVRLASSKAEPFYWPRYTVPPGPSAEDVNAIKAEAVKQMKYGKPEFAVTLLKKVYEDCKNEPEPAYNVEMALVEILIYQGKYREALECNCLKDEQRIPSDGRFPFYKAIIYTMLNMEEAKKWWEEFAETIDDEEFDPTKGFH